MKGLVAALLVVPAVFGVELGGRFHRLISRLDPTQPSSLCIAQDRFRSQFGNAAAPGQAAALFELWAYYDKAVRQNQDRIEGLGQGLTAQQMEILLAALRSKRTEPELAVIRQKAPGAWRRVEDWSRCGYAVAVDFDDTIILDPDPWFLRKLSDRLRPALRDYIDLFLKESPYHLDYDGGLAIPWDRLRSRIGRWERFRAAHSDTPELAAYIDRQIKAMFEYYLCGMPNSDVLDDTGRVNADLRESYARFLNTNRESRSYGLVERAVAILRAQDWKCSADLIQLYEAAGHSTEFLKQGMDRVRQ